MLPTELAYRLKTSLNDAIIPMTKELPTVPYEEDLTEAIGTSFILSLPIFSSTRFF